MKSSTTLIAAITATVLAATASACGPNNQNPISAAPTRSAAPTTPDARMPVVYPGGSSAGQYAFAVNAHTWVTPETVTGTLDLHDEDQQDFTTTTLGCADGVQVMHSDVDIEFQHPYPLLPVRKPTKANIGGSEPVTVSPAGPYALKISPASHVTADGVKYLKGFDIEDAQGRALGVFDGGALAPNEAAIEAAENAGAGSCH